MAALYPSPLPCIGSLLDTQGSGTIILDAATGTFALGGVGVYLKVGHRLVAETGTFEWTGIEASLNSSGIGSAEDAAPLPCLSSLMMLPEGVHILFGGTGQFQMVGNRAGFGVGHGLIAEPGAFVSEWAPGENDYQITASPGAFTFAGGTATLTKGRRLIAGVGGFAWIGYAAGLSLEQPGVFRLIADTGEFVVSGVDANSVRTYILHTTAGEFELDGEVAQLRVVRWAPFSVPPQTWETISKPDSIWTQIP